MLEILIEKIKDNSADISKARFSVGVFATELLEAMEATQSKKNNEKENNKEDSVEKGETLEVVADEEATDEKIINEKKDAVALLAKRIKDLYAGEMQQHAYVQTIQAKYNVASAYGSTNNVKTNGEMYNMQEYDSSKAQSDQAQNNGVERLKDENSIAYKLSKGSRMQAFIMTDPKGRLHSTWEVVRVFNETYDGKLEQNNGLHYQGLS